MLYQNPLKPEFRDNITIFVNIVFLPKYSAKPQLLAGVQKVGTAGTADKIHMVGQNLDGCKNNWTNYGKSEKILSYSDKLDF